MRATLAVVALMMLGCAVPDLNQPCRFLKSDGGFLSEQAAREAMLPEKVFVGFGAAECSSRVCVRDATVVGTGVDEAPALGYCSGQCAGPNECAVRGSPALSCSLVISPEVAQLSGQSPTQPIRLCARTASP